MNATAQNQAPCFSFLRSRARLLPLLLATAACSVPTAETAAEKTGAAESAYSNRTLVDGSVARSKALPLNPNIVYVLGTDGNLWRENGSSSDRTLVDGNVKDFQPIDGTTVYVLSNDTTLWREVGSTANRSAVDYGVTSFQALGDAYTVYALGGDGNLWREFGSYQSRQQVDGNVTAFQALDETTVYVQGSDAKLWRETVTMSNRTQVDANVTSFKAIDATTVYVLGSDGILWNESGSSSSRFQVDASVQSFVPVDGVVVYVEGTDGNLWREVQDSRFRDPVDGSVSAFQPIGNQLVYVLGGNGNLWRETMAPAPWVLTAQNPSGTGADFIGSVGIWPSGDYIFAGHAHDNNALSYNDTFALGVKTSTGQLFTFTHQGSIGGWGAPTPDDYWTTPGSSTQLAAAFNSIQLPPGYADSISPAVDLGGILNGIETTLGVVANVIAIVGPLLA
jgi:hypothetical protein